MVGIGHVSSTERPAGRDLRGDSRQDGRIIDKIHGTTIHQRRPQTRAKLPMPGLEPMAR
jgi:hypothetical protein